MELPKKRNVKLCIAVHSTNYYLSPSLRCLRATKATYSIVFLLVSSSTTAAINLSEGAL